MAVKRENEDYREAQKLYYREWYKKNGRKRNIKYNLDWYYKNKDKMKVHGKVFCELKKGNIKKPPDCSVCRRKTRLFAHHHDYSKPLEIMWLCGSCHKLIHHGLHTPNVDATKIMVY